MNWYGISHTAIEIRVLLFISRRVCIGNICGHVVAEGEASRRLTATPAAKIRVQQALISAIEASGLERKFLQARISFQRRRENKDTRVEAVRPTHISSRRELFAREQLVDILDDEAVSVQEHTLGELGEAPAVELGECDPEVGTC